MKLNLNIQPLNTWIQAKHEPLLIAGPCSAETEDQLVATAHLLAATGKVTALRAGIWKPRTRPGEFEGIGSIGLEWLKRAKEETGLPTTVEVATGKHVEEALKAGVDILWVGARSTVNPFTVQEIADALKGVDVPVMVKNPVNPDLSLWIGALERINNAGITKLAAIHRGFSSFEKTGFRNEPMWDIAINLKTLAPELPIICDPSHITGNRALIGYVSQKALDLDMQGLMIESHIDPSVAWTDAAQQVTPGALSEIIDHLVLRKPEIKDIDVKDALSELRAKIDKIGGKWKILIIYAVSKNVNRFSSLKRALPLISKQMLVNQLRELEEDGILERIIYPEIPPRVEYKLTVHGLTLMPVIGILQEWGISDLKLTRKTPLV